MKTRLRSVNFYEIINKNTLAPFLVARRGVSVQLHDLYVQYGVVARNIIYHDTSDHTINPV